MTQTSLHRVFLSVKSLTSH